MNNIQGKVSFVHHDKDYITIDYEINGKQKNINGKVDDATQQDWVARKINRKKHRFLVGDTVEFNIELSPRGDRQVATNIHFLYNTAIDALIDKSRTHNRFLGYLKEVDGKYFVKEADSYLFFPLPLAPWQLPPAEERLNEAIDFSLENTDKRSAITAKLINSKYISEFYTLVKASKSKTPVKATITSITPHAVHVRLLHDLLRSKITAKEGQQLKEGDEVEVLVTHIGDNRIVVEQVG